MGFAFLLCCFLILDSCSSVRSCLQCDQVVRYIHEDFLSSVPMTVSDQMELKEIIEHAYINYRETSRSFRGVIDPTTLYRARTEYQSEFKRHWKEHRTGSLQWIMINIVEKGRRILQKHLELFVTQGLCPNKCGLFYQRVMNCTSCQYGLFTCLSATPPIDCGEHHLEADEGVGVVLDCFLPWHTLVVGQTEYYYSWLPAKNLSHEGGYEELVVTEDSKIVLNQLRVNEEGVYRCLLQDQKNTTLSRIYFYLKVNPLPSTTPRPVVTLPPLPVGYDLTPPSLHRNSVVILVILLTVVSITGSLVILMYLGVTMKQHKERDGEGSRRGERQDAENMELMSVTQ
ncbi:izumo sperm-egg fusion protein 1 isoform X2 [Triplophysa dalaica]|uniref:izumo sperm-egg fusion protein 1 isoform X2 n=1 Tax=Triplophysa dalaica TaxID=1582913 RepID=UPI0024DFF066|nr:izumo sperm-egg fusion protein 1 isoform X2 [Triplophysa dalaica]